MPIYPLEEDIRPGDIYLVDKSIDSEVSTWNRKGFLPLNNRFGRMHIPKKLFESFYSNSHVASDSVSFSRPPKAAFPSYTFEIDKRGALGLALPLNSVPVAISASGAQSATGSVVFTGAETRGLPDLIMQRQVDRWQKDHRKALSNRAKYTDHPLILRLITRVFTIKGATVSLAFSKESGANLQVGSTSATNPTLSTRPFDKDKPLTKDYEGLITEINKNIELMQVSIDNDSNGVSEQDKKTLSEEVNSLKDELAAIKKLEEREKLRNLKRKIERGAMEGQFGGYLLPGGGIKVVGRSARGVTMSETFDRPLVLGFWATEYSVTDEGSLIHIGRIKDLIENPSKYKSLVIEAQQIVGMKESESTIDPGKGKNPFEKKII